MTVSTVFLLLLIYSVGNAWAKFLPRRSPEKRIGFGRFIHFINPGEFTLKEVILKLTPNRNSFFEKFSQHAVASLVASTAAGGSSAVNNFAVQKVRNQGTNQINDKIFM